MVAGPRNVAQRSSTVYNSQYRGLAQLVARCAGVKPTCGGLQGNLLLKTCFQRRSFGVAEGDAEVVRPLYHGKIDIYRDVAQLVARCAGGAEVASSSLVIPTKDS